MTAAASSNGERWIRRLTTASVVVLAGIAAVVSYRHMHTLALAHGEVAWTAALIPLSVDGMIVASSMSLLLDSRSGVRSGVLPWVLLLVGSTASLAANVAVAEPTVYGRVIAAWPSLALIGAYELLMRQIRHHTAAATQPTTSTPRTSRPTNRHHDPAPDAGPPGDHIQPRLADPRLDQLDPTVLGRARQINAEHWAKTGRPASAETLRIQLRVGAATARTLRAHLRQETRPVHLERAPATVGCLPAT